MSPGALRGPLGRHPVPAATAELATPVAGRQHRIGGAGDGRGAGSFGGLACLGFAAGRRCDAGAAGGGGKPGNGAGFRPMGATSRALGSFAESRVRSSDSWVRSSLSWVFLGSIVGSFVEKRPKCAAIRYISNANGAYSGTVFTPMCRPATHRSGRCSV
jgi:hypothetical protein